MARTRIPLSAEEEAFRQQQQKLDMSTAEIGLAVRTTNCLEERGIFTVRDLLNSTPEQLLSITNFGEKTLDEVYRAVEAIGFRRRDAKTPR
ncbi:MAG TPA: DNA-directed RNA polymerase subunit alpha C-terminal domain-containing protein [Pirellulaceae bacterium]|nr:DNA-directed RNA polymerase subunit alpha C-terminal domain-containing protein [Pirellulaceae bacterium]